LYFKGTPSQDKTIFSSLKIYEMALSDQIDLAEFFSVIYQNFINAEI
jgi:hypothetical protein